MLQDDLIGRQLANFRVDGLLGRGGMGQVYSGWDVKLNRRVAIKIIDTRYREDIEYAQRFINEAQAVATWHHENIIQVYYADEEDGLYYFVMEYIDGQSLRELQELQIKKGTFLAHETVLRI